MQINSVSKISFQKTLVGHCNVIKDNKPEKCDIYKLDEFEEMEYFNNSQRKKDWQNAYYWNRYTQSGYMPKESGEIFVLEEDDKCIGYVDISCDYPGMSIDFFEANPKYKGSDKNKKIKYIGESIIAFLAHKAQKEKIPFISVFAWSVGADKFYVNKCGFDKNKVSKIDFLLLNEDKYQDIISQNEVHTKGKMEIYG